MENASKALLMAAGVLIGLMIISLAVLLFNSFGGTSATIHQNIETQQIEQFNSQFTVYNGKDNVTIYDIISMANLATQNNKQYEFHKGEGNDKNNYINIRLQGESIEYGVETSSKTQEDNYNEKIKKDTEKIGQAGGSTDLPTYSVTVEISQYTKRVYKVICNKN